VTSHDGAGRPLAAVDANGVVTTLSYTPQGWLASVAVAGAGGTATTAIAYDAAGLITQITRPDGSFLAYTHDAAHRLTQVSDAFGGTIAFTLDALGDRTETQIAASGGGIVKTQSAVFDDLGRLLQSIGAAGQTTLYAYDNNANVTGITDPLSNATSRSFDALNRLIAAAAPLSSRTAYAYDAHDNLTGSPIRAGSSPPPSMTGSTISSSFRAPIPASRSIASTPPATASSRRMPPAMS